MLINARTEAILYLMWLFGRNIHTNIVPVKTVCTIIIKNKGEVIEKEYFIAQTRQTKRK